jgi:undecaprenyl-diphosphatase
MPLLHAIVLGIVQGFTEFLPISSSGHLQIVPWLFGWNDFDDAGVKKAFDVALHLGTFPS